jgi:hypothetical protein
LTRKPAPSWKTPARHANRAAIVQAVIVPTVAAATVVDRATIAAAIVVPVVAATVVRVRIVAKIVERATMALRPRTYRRS